MTSLYEHALRIYADVRAHRHLATGCVLLALVATQAPLAIAYLSLRARPAPAAPEAASEWHPRDVHAPGRLLPQPLPEGQPGDLAERVCAHANKICPQRDTCAGTVRLREKDGLDSMREDRVLAAHTEAELLATGVWRCWR